MKKILRSWGGPLALVCFGVSTAWAAFGPCNVTRPAAFNTTIGCYGGFVPFAMECHCGGMAAILPEASVLTLRKRAVINKIIEGLKMEISQVLVVQKNKIKGNRLPLRMKAVQIHLAIPAKTK